MDTSDRVVALELKVKRLTVLLLSMPLICFGLGMGTMELQKVVYDRVRARTFEVFDKDRGGEVMDLEKAIISLKAYLIDNRQAIQDVHVIAQRAYEASGAESEDKAAAAAEAQKKAAEQLARELAAIREEISRARDAAKSDADRKRMDDWERSIEEQKNQESLRSDIRRIRRELERRGQ